MTNMEVLIDQGKKLGLEGKDLLEFIKDQQNKEREERRERREAEAKQAELRKQEKEAEAELRRLAAEADERRLVAEERKAKLDHELEMERLRLSIPAGAGNGNGSGNGNGIKAKAPRLPAFVDDQDDLDAYLERFERYAMTQGWKAEDWATDLSALLSGKALGVYARLSNDEAKDYDKVKDALLKRYQLTEDGFRLKFREGQPESGESPGQFLTRIGNYLARWMKLANAGETYEGLRNLIIMEQYIRMCPKDLAVYLKERHHETMEEVAVASEKFLEAHGKTLATGQGKKDSKNSQSQQKGPQRGWNNSGDQGNDIQCYNCSRRGHGKQHCRQKGGGNETKCVHCGLFGHEGSMCRRGKNFAAANSAQQLDETQVGALCYGSNKHEVSWGVEISANENKEEYIMLSWNNKERADEILKVCKGKVGEHVVSTLRDSGCSTICVNRKLVKPEQLTGESYTCLFLNGSTLQAPVALVDIDTPYLKKSSVKALCLNEPAYDLVIGDVEGARCKCDPDESWKLEEVNAVTNSAQSLTGNKVLKPLRVMVNDSEEDVTPALLMKLQREDESLNRVRSLDPVTERANKKTWYSFDKGILYRNYQSDLASQDKGVKQVVVPKLLHKKGISK